MSRPQLIPGRVVSSTRTYQKRSTGGSRARTVPLDKIRLDGDTQSRKELDEDVIKQYGDLIAEGVEFPPLDVVFDGADYWLVDGFHRRWAAVKQKVKAFKCNVVQGTREDARWLSYGVNKDHGLPRTPADKVKAILAALKHPRGVKLSDRQIAAHVGVDHKTVGKYRTAKESSGEIPQIDSRTVTRGGTTYEQNTANIGIARQRDEACARASASGTGAAASSAPAKAHSPAAPVPDDDDDDRSWVNDHVAPAEPEGLFAEVRRIWERMTQAQRIQLPAMVTGWNEDAAERAA